ncbi:6-phosphogluconolactonase [Vulcanococcus limneticus]|uniref:6-phosphogluconolactonase n=1 Tax=Vulcanococcus limneticus TaxID=2170428 RepID=UPI000B9811C0|nr:6-phosphogluconolactonase [Vulcanococcus limneticus]MCP9791597.1 6-phosphogluconolactonase [Vulcanococcus limneticus MW73D5]MCP9893453.1 6-phosphogluconolactonase [Vulcanococcus limneticus Candia 3F8]MCP9896989.1 6-phosphogluconolactonase [Vulcanococcus limneticus Candia 3B3]
MSPSSARYKLEVAPGPDDLARRAAQRIATAIDLALDERDRCQIALSGGTTPAAAYRLLGQEHLPWDRVDVLLGDERWVSASDPASNARLLAETLLAQEPARQARFHPVPTDLDSPTASAHAFEALVRRLCPGDPPVFDLMLLGLGDDGHTASLFPGSTATTVRDRAVTVGQGKGLDRITLTAPVLSAARQVIVLVSGTGKRQALERLLDPAESPERTPARLVQPRSPVLVLADAAAAAGLTAPA